MTSWCIRGSTAMRDWLSGSWRGQQSERCRMLRTFLIMFGNGRPHVVAALGQRHRIESLAQPPAVARYRGGSSGSEGESKAGTSCSEVLVPGG